MFRINSISITLLALMAVAGCTREVVKPVEPNGILINEVAAKGNN